MELWGTWCKGRLELGGLSCPFQPKLLRDSLIHCRPSARRCAEGQRSAAARPKGEPGRPKPCSCHAPAFPHPGNSPAATAGPSLPRCRETPPTLPRRAGEPVWPAYSRPKPPASPPGPGIPVPGGSTGAQPGPLRLAAAPQTRGSAPAASAAASPPARSAAQRRTARHIPPPASPYLGQRWRSCYPAPAAAIPSLRAASPSSCEPGAVRGAGRERRTGCGGAGLAGRARRSG